MRRLPDKYDRNQKHYQTGYWGVWSTRSNKFCFGIQTLTKTEAMQKLKIKTGRSIRRTQFVVKGISTGRKWDFIEPLMWREDFEEWRDRNEYFKKVMKNKAKSWSR